MMGLAAISTEGEQTGALVPRPAPTEPSRTMKQHQPVSIFSRPHHSQDTAVSKTLYTLTHTHSHSHTTDKHIFTPRGADTLTYTHIASSKCLVSLFVPVSHLFTAPHYTHTHTLTLF